MYTETKAPTYKYFSDLHHDHRMWLNTLQFRKEEIGILENRIAEVASRNSDQGVMAELEHFQNQLIRQREVIDELRHEVKQHENMLEKEALDRPIALEHRHYTDHTELRDRMDTFERLFMEMKTDLYRWVGKWL